MDYKIVEKQVSSSDGIHSLCGKLYIPNGEIKGFFHVVHGMTEHIGRYDRFLGEMAKRGYLAFAFDNLGHGKTVNDNLELGFIADKNGWKYLIEDIKVFYNAVKLEYGDMPYYLFGHSMGSFIVRVAVCRTVFPNKVILSGTGGKNKLAGLGIMLSSVIKAFKGKRHVSKFMDKIVFGSYNNGFESEGSKRSWITSDSSLRDKYDLDPLYNYRLSISALKEVITLNKIANSKREYQKFSKDLAVFLICGNEDPVSKRGEGVLEVNEKLKAVGVNAKTKIYNGRHEIFNEPQIKEQVLTDVLEFIEK